MRHSLMTDGQTDIHSIHINMPLYGYEGAAYSDRYNEREHGV